MQLLIALILFLSLPFCSCSPPVSQEKLIEITKELGIPSNGDAFDAYLQQQLALGSKKEAVFDALKPIEPKRLIQTRSNLPDSTPECYIVEFYELVGHRLFDRYWCFDDEDQIIKIYYLIGLE